MIGIADRHTVWTRLIGGAAAIALMITVAITLVLMTVSSGNPRSAAICADHGGVFAGKSEGVVTCADGHAYFYKTDRLYVDYVSGPPVRG
jgi:L-asparagine transporter-like permease